jgi:ArsR family transcriptional regulator
MQKLSQKFKAMSVETRLRILSLLSHGELCVCDLVDILGELQTKVSRHLAYLKHAGWVTDRREGQWVFYSLAEPEDYVHRCLTECISECFSTYPQMAEDLRKLEGKAKLSELRSACVADV